MKAGERNKGGLILAGIVIASALFVLYGIGWLDITIPPIQPPPDGSLPPVTFKTDVKISEPAWSLQPHIDYVKTEKVGGATASAGKPELLVLPWEGKLKMTVAYPSGDTVVYTKDVKIEWWSERVYTFYWQTKQAGDHLITVELINGDGNVIDSKTETVTR